MISAWVSSFRRRVGPSSDGADGAYRRIRRSGTAAAIWWRRRGRFASAGGYALSVGGVAAVTWLISLVLPRYRIANVSMIYLLLVLGLAVSAGSGPAILASVLAFLAFDWFFVQPLHRFTVDDPSEWLALFLFLVVAIISGQLAAELRRRAAEARRRSRETATLYETSMAILGDAHVERVLNVIAERMVTTLGLRSVGIALLNSDGRLEPATEAGEPLRDAEIQERELNARWAMETGGATERYALAGNARLTRPVERARKHQTGDGGRLVASYLPIVLGAQSLGVVTAVHGEGDRSFTEEQQHLLEALVAQTALAVGRAKLTEGEEKARAAADSERMKSTFLASVSHDLRTPLTAIKASAEGLRQDAELRSDRTHGELATSIVEEVGRLDRLVGNLLEISRIEAGGLPLHRAPQDLSEIIGSVISRLGAILERRRLMVDISEDLPLVTLDAVQIDRVLTNLLDNAVKFSPEGSEIALDVDTDGDNACIRIHNAGRPLGAEERERIFDKFYRLDASERGPHGVGLGLAICKGIVEAHGGDIWAENDTSGVTFVARLPLEARR